MRFTIYDGEGEPIDIHSLGHGARTGWLIAKEGVEGWYGTPEPRNGAVEAAGHDGDYAPIDLTSGARTVTIEGAIKEPSNLAFARALDRLNSLMGKTIELHCDDFCGTRVCSGFVSDDPAPTVYARDNFATFTLVITCPDPLRYGKWAYYSLADSARVFNGGNAKSYPKLIVEPREEGAKVTTVTLQCGSQKVVWSGSGTDTLEIDLAEMVPTYGTVSQDNAFAIPPGGATVKCYTDGVATLMCRDAWR